MKKIAVFGKPGSGKSVLSKRLAAALDIELTQLDSLVYKANGDQVERTVYDQMHQEILDRPEWLIDGFGPLGSFYERLAAADTLIYIDLPYTTSYWLVTKRLLKGVFVKPEGWPEGSSVWKGSLNSYRTLKLCPKFWNDEFRRKLDQLAEDKTLVVLDSLKAIRVFLQHHENWR